MKKTIHKKDQGIALIFSLFFLLILFAIGVTLLFRAQMNKRTSTALTNSDLDKLRAKGAMSIIQNTISHAMKDKTSASFEDAFGTAISSDTAVLQDEYTLRSSSYKSSANSLRDYNDNDNNVGNYSTDMLFKFYQDGEEVAPSYLEWQLFNHEAELIDNATGKTLAGDSIAFGDNGFRLSYIVIDQTGKINPNTTVSPKNLNEGISYNVLAESTASPYDLSNLFTADKINSANHFANQTHFSNITDLYKHNNANLNPANRDFINNNFYPFGVSLTHEEIPVAFDTAINGISERLNLHSIYDKSLYADPSADDDTKVQEIIDALPYLKHIENEGIMVSKNEDSNWKTGQKLVNNPDGYNPSTQSENVPLAKKIAANLKDYIDDDCIATTNYDISDPDNLPTVTEDIYVGHEEISITGINFFAFSSYFLAHDRHGIRSSYERHSAIAFSPDTYQSTSLVPQIEVAVDMDLNGTEISKINVASSDPSNPPDLKGKLKAYVAYKAGLYCNV